MTSFIGRLLILSPNQVLTSSNNSSHLLVILCIMCSMLSSFLSLKLYLNSNQYKVNNVSVIKFSFVSAPAPQRSGSVPNNHPGSHVSGPFIHTHKALCIKGNARYFDTCFSYRYRSYFAHIITSRFVSLSDTFSTL
jgi:hypothetical protein